MVKQLGITQKILFSRYVEYEAKMFTSGRKQETLYIVFWGMLNPFLTGSTLANQGIPLKIKKFKMAAVRVAHFDIS